MTLCEATQNPHFEKIRKAVIMNRHLEAEIDITVQNILELLKEIKNLIFVSSSSWMRFYDDISISNIIEWRPCESLHGQPPETWEKIANLIS